MSAPLDRLTPLDQLMVARAGHNPHDERTAEVLREIRDFLPAPPRVSTAA